MGIGDASLVSFAGEVGVAHSRECTDGLVEVSCDLREGLEDLVSDPAGGREEVGLGGEVGNVLVGWRCFGE